MTVSRRSRRAFLSCLVVIDICLVLLAGSRFFTRVDLSRNGVYTLSRTSKEIVAGLPEHLSLEYYVSGVLASRYPFPARIEDLLGEYVTWSGGRVSVRVLDPARLPGREAPESLGLAARQIQMVDRDQVNGAAVYSGIVLRYLDRSETLPFVADLTTLEYDLSSRIRSLERNRVRTIGVLVGDSRRSLSRDFRALTSELDSQFQVEEIRPRADIPAEVSVLFVLGNRDLDAAELVPVDQYIMRGGKALFAVDSVDIHLSGTISAEPTRRKAIQKMLGQYGVRVMDAMVLDDINQKISFTVPPGRYEQVEYPPWLRISGRYVDQTHPITARFSGLDLYWPCPLEPIARDGVKAEVLARSSPDAWLLRNSFDINPALAGSMKPAPGQQRASEVLAIALSGTFRSAFAGGPLTAQGGEKQRELLPASSRDTRIIVVGNAEFATDMAQVTQAAYNMTFLSNCAEWLAQADDLLAVKTRGQGSTRLDAIPDPDSRARAMRWSVVVNLLIVPLVVAAAGMIRLLSRRRKRAKAPETPDSRAAG